MTFKLKIEVDEPGRRLVLAGQAPALPGGALVSLIGGLLGRVRVLSRLAFDRAKDRIEITEAPIFGGGASEPELIPFADLRGMNVSAAPATSRSTQAAQGLTVTVKLIFLEETGRAPRQLALDVEGLDKNEEAGDLALRLASVAGFEYQRVVRSNPREIEIEFSTLGMPGFFPLPETVARADYERDQVSQPAQAMVARESTPPFDPGSLQSEFKVLAWQPGQDVRFKRSLGFAAIGCLPGVALLGLGPMAFYAAGRQPSNSLRDQILVGCIAGLFGLVFGGISAAAVYTALPRLVAFDWMERKLKIRGLLRQSDYDFADLQSLELKGAKYHHTPKNGPNYWTYASSVIANVASPGSGTKAIEILSTTSFREDPATPYRMALPLVTDLAKALGVKRVVTDYQ